MKKLLLTSLALSLALMAWGVTIPLSRSVSDVSLSESRDDGINVHYSISDLRLTDVTTTRGQFTLLTAEGLSLTKAVGEPQLPVSRKVIAVPLNATVTPQVQSATVQDYRLSDYGITSPIFPAQPSLSKSQKPEDVPFVYNSAAYQNGFTRDDVVTVEELGIMRGMRLFLLTVRPVDYDAVNGVLRVRTDMAVRVDYNGGDMAATEHLRKVTKSPYYEGLYRQTVFNYRPLQGRDSITEYPVKYVIISDPMFEEALQPFIDWKKQKGFEVIVGYKGAAEVGSTTTSIHTYLQNLYNAGTEDDPAPSFLLIVGDVAQIPAWNGATDSHITDLNYAKLAGNDYIPEMYYGRFSASTVAQLQPQIDKTMEYEEYTMPDPSYLQDVIMIAGVDDSHGSSWGNGQINYGTTYYFNEAHGINSHTYLYPSSGSSEAQIIANFNAGVGYANYTAHGSEDGWYDPSLDVSDVNALTNADKYPFVVGNCCLTNSFQVDTCLGEAFLRAANKGAIGYIGGTNSSYWDEDFYWGVGAGSIVANPTYETHGEGAYDGMFHDMANETDPADWYVTAGAMIYCGNLAVAEGGGNINYYWEIYALMGDPSLMPYMGQPVANTVDYDGQILLGVTEFQVTADPYSQVALTLNGELHGFGITDANGSLTMNIVPFEEPATASLVIIAEDRVPIVTTIDVLPNNGPYVVSHMIQTTDGNDNIPSYGDTVTLTMEFENVGIDPANGVVATLTFTDDYLTLINGSASYETIAAGQTLTVSPFSFSIANNVPDQHVVSMTVTVTNGTDTWMSEFNLTILAPMISFDVSPVVNDSETGNGNGRLDPGETATVALTINNSGSLPTPAMELSFVSENPWFVITGGTMQLVALNAGEATAPEFTVSINELLPPGFTVTGVASITAGVLSASQNYPFSVGLEVEDFETGNFASYGWAMSGNAVWAVDHNNGHDSGYAARSGNIANNQNSTIGLTMSVETDASISFYRKVSSQADHDYLQFLMDNQVVDSWSGLVDWGIETYPVTAGMHSFKWKYLKDNATAENSDCAWIDDIAFPMAAADSVAILGISEDTFDFGDIAVGETATASFNLTNFGNDILTGTITTIPGFTVQIVETRNSAIRNRAARDLDFSIDSGTTVSYEITFTPTEAVDYSGVLTITSNDTVNPTSTITVTGAAFVDTDDSAQVPFVTKLDGNSPNPFNPDTAIAFSLAENANVSLRVFDTRGRLVRTLLSNEAMAVGNHSVTWNGTDDSRNPVASGVYFYEMRGGKYTSVKKMILLK
jgi:uncharacterized repeat protein (TIGR01451 family)